MQARWSCRTFERYQRCRSSRKKIDVGSRSPSPTQPLVSVIMPVRNGKRWIHESMASVLCQDFEDFELVIIDDGSDDGSASILEKYSCRDERIRVIHQAPQGTVAALNRGILEAHALLLARMDADDRAKPERLGRQYRFMQAHPEVVLLGSDADVIDASGAIIGQRSPPADNIELAHLLARSNPFIHSSIMMRTALVRNLGGYRSPFLLAEDYDLWLRMAEFGSVANLSKRLIQYRVHQADHHLVNAARQSFSARLAQRSAQGRRCRGKDPAIALSSPPDWWAADSETSFFSVDVGFYRFVDSDKANAVSYLSQVWARFFSLNHVERKLAQLRLKQLLREFGWEMRLSQVEAAILFLILHPPRAIRLMFQSNSGDRERGTQKKSPSHSEGI